MIKIIDENLKLKMSGVIFIIINVILQPFCIMLYVNNKFGFSDIVIQFFCSLYVSYVFSVFINEYIFKVVLVDILGGKQIKNKLENYAEFGLAILTVLLYYSWVLDLFEGTDNGLILPLSAMILIYFIVLQDKKLIVYNEYIFLGFKIINVKHIVSYKKSEYNSIKIKREKIELKLKKGKKLSFVRDPINILKFSKYLDEHNIKNES